MRLAGSWLTMAAAICVPACFDGELVNEPVETEPPRIVSNPVSSLSAAGAIGSPGALGATNVAYVSLPPDSIPNGEIAVIRNTRTGSTARTAMADGGFDPFPVVATAGDRLELDIQVSGGGPGVHAVFEVPEYRKPRVVRTRPVAKKRDVVLNAVLTIVFSEPISEQTVGPASVQLLRTGAPVSGRLTVGADGLRAEFQPDQLLAPNTDYVLSVTTGVTDLTGDQLEQAVAAEFTTGTTTATAMVYTDPAALFTVSNGELRTSEFSAILHDDGRVTGDFKVFNPALNVRVSGSVTCVTIVDGTAAWVGAVIEEMSGTLRQTTVGMEAVWRAGDNGPAGGGVADRLSYASSLPDSSHGTAQDFCDNTPPSPKPGVDEPMNDVEIGDIVVSGRAAPRGATALRHFSGGGTVGTVNTALTESFRVYVLDASGNTVSGVPIEWTVTAGGGTISPEHHVTVDSLGVGHAISSAVLTLGPEEGTHTATATAPTLPGAPQVTFTATAVSVMVEVRDSEDGGFVPEVATVPPGKSVAWIYSSQQGRLHNVTFEDDPTEPVSSGVLWLPGMYHVRTFGAGTYTIRYRCTYHSTGFTEGEVGTVTVRDPATVPKGIAFQGAGSQIYVMHTDGSGAVRLTSGSANGDPAWSPDGSTIAYWRAGPSVADRHIYVMGRDGSNPRSLTAATGDDGDWNGGPAWSPDGTRIVFSHSVGSGSPQLYLMNADGTGVTQLTTWDLYGVAYSWRPSWSPDGTRIAFEGRDITWEIANLYVINTDGTGLAALTTGGLDRSPAWSPDGTRIAFVRGTDIYGGDGDIYVMNADGTGITRLTSTGREHTPAWSPDGTRIAFQSFRDGNWEIYVMNANGTGATNVTNTADSDEGSPAWFPSH